MDKINQYIEKQNSPQKEICQKLRAIIFNTFPDIKEEMKSKIIKTSLLLFLFFLITPTTYAQVSSDTTTIWTITTFDGNEYIGSIIKEDSVAIHLKTNTIGVIVIPIQQIESREKVDAKNIMYGEFWFENPQSTRYFWGPNGYGLKKGEGYYQNIWILANQASYGFSDNFTMGIGTVPLFLFAFEAAEYSPFWVTPKFSFPIVPDKINLGTGAFLIGISNVGFAGLVYGSVSYGSRDNNASFNLGYGVVDGEWSNSPTVSLSFMRRVRKRTYLLSENYFISAGSENLIILSFGARTVWNKISLDYGLVGGVFDGELGQGAVPWLGFSIPLGKLRRGN